MRKTNNHPSAVLISAGSWHLRQTGKELQKLDALAGIYLSDKNSTGIKPELYHRCWPFHLAIIPFCLLNGPRTTGWSRFFWGFLPIWIFWLKRQKIPHCNIIHSIGVFAKEAFDIAEKTGALKVYDAANSHPIPQIDILEKELKKWLPRKRIRRDRYWFQKRATEDIKRADLVLCPSTFVLESMLANGVPESRCALLPFGADASTFTPREKLPTTPRFICVGTIMFRKGHQYLFPAFAALKEKTPSAELICVGSIDVEFMSIFKKWKHIFTHIPFMPHNQLAKLLKTCTAFVLPALEEGYARVIAEALAAGLPVVATHQSGATTTIENNKEGLIIPPYTVEPLTEALEKLATDDELCIRLGQNAYKKSTSLTWQDYGKKLFSEYEKLIKKHQTL